MEDSFNAGIILDGVAVSAVLPKGDIAAFGAGGCKGAPEIGVNPMGGSNAVIFLQAGRNGPEQAPAEELGLGLSAAAEFAVKGVVRVGIGLKAGGIALSEQTLRIALEKFRGSRAGCFPKKSGVFGDVQCKSGKRRLLGQKHSLLVRFAGVRREKDRGDFTALTVEKRNLGGGKGIVSVDIAAPEIGVELIAGNPVKKREVVLKNGGGIPGGIDAEEQPERSGGSLFISLRGLRRESSNGDNFCLVCIFTCHKNTFFL